MSSSFPNVRPGSRVGSHQTGSIVTSSLDGGRLSEGAATPSLPAASAGARATLTDTIGDVAMTIPGWGEPYSLPFYVSYQRYQERARVCA